jgi:hypothetical protein
VHSVAPTKEQTAAAAEKRVNTIETFTARAVALLAEAAELDLERTIAGRLGEAGAQGVVTDPPAGAISVLALRGKQRCAGPDVVAVEVAPHVLDEPAQGPTSIIDQRHHSLTRPAPSGAFAGADVQLAEPAQGPT